VSPLRLYRELAAWWPLFSPPEDYVEEASYLAQILQETVVPRPRTVLELGSGGGSNAFHLKRQFAMTLVDIAPDMLAVSQAINPECEHLIGDIRCAWGVVDAVLSTMPSCMRQKTTYAGA
jgi:SAM-dependent methyltransferase